MKYNIKALPTVYAQTRFRSKLEAQWAVFFDFCGIQWEYEPGTYQTDCGVITPDFLISEGFQYLNGVPGYVEIKPENFNLKSDDAKALFDKYRELRGALAYSDTGTEDNVAGFLIVAGSPRDIYPPQFAPKPIKTIGECLLRNGGGCMQGDRFRVGVPVFDADDVDGSWDEIGEESLYIKAAMEATNYDFKGYVQPNKIVGGRVAPIEQQCWSPKDM
jgi:hypothetical protein